MKPLLTKTLIALFLFYISPYQNAQSHTIKIAVATNFKPALEELLKDFQTSHKQGFSVTSGSSGQLHSQILFGAPFDIFFSADKARAENLEGKVSTAQRNSYALGKLVLFTPKIGAQNLQTLNQLNIPIVMANPAIAPYGMAAKQMLNYISLWQQFSPNIILANSNAQVFHYIKTGHAEAGFLSLSFVLQENPDDYWIIPRDYHLPIDQQYIVIKHKDYKAKAKLIDKFLEFVHSEPGQAIISKWGYSIP